MINFSVVWIILYEKRYLLSTYKSHVICIFICYIIQSSNKWVSLCFFKKEDINTLAVIRCQHSDLNHPLVGHKINHINGNYLEYSLSFVTMIKELKKTKMFFAETCQTLDIPIYWHGTISSVILSILMVKLTTYLFWLIAQQLAINIAQSPKSTTEWSIPACV